MSKTIEQLKDEMDAKSKEYLKAKAIAQEYTSRHLKAWYTTLDLQRELRAAIKAYKTASGSE